MDARIQHLEGAGALGAAPVAAAVGVIAAQEIRPSYTLASAVPAAASGASFLPPSAAVPANLREQILAGKDVNLVKILLCGPCESSESRLVECGNMAVFFAGRRSPSYQDSDVVRVRRCFWGFPCCHVRGFPRRRVELDTYLAIIADLSLHGDP